MKAEKNKQQLNSCSYIKMELNVMKKSFKIEVDCANCANKMELSAQKVSGVKSVVVNFMALKMIVELEEGYTFDLVMPEILKACKKIERDCEIYF